MARYQITPQAQEGTTTYLLTDTERHAEAVVCPEYGNNCILFRTTPDPDGKDIRGAACPPVDLLVPPKRLADLRESPFHAGNPILFPFPSRIRQGRFTFEGRTYTMEKLLAKGRDKNAGQAIHGFVGDQAWTVEEAKADAEGASIRAALQLDSVAEIAEQYPFPCRIAVTYRLQKGQLTMHTEVTNTGATNLPMGFGVHPWFPVLLRAGVRLPEGLAQLEMSQRAQAEVKIPARAVWELENLLPSGRTLPAADLGLDLHAFRPLGESHIDNLFTHLDRGPNGWSEGGLRDPASGLEMYFAADGAFREWVLYTPPDRPLVALEPYTCTGNVFNLQAEGVDAGLVVLAPGQTWEGTLCFGLRRLWISELEAWTERVQATEEA